jgi:hypothetical protein
MRISTSVVLFLLIGGTAGCGSSSPTTPSAPPPPPAPRTPVIAEFSDPASAFKTRDVRDVDDQIVQFDTANNALIWGVDGRSFPGYAVNGNFIGGFQVRFGTKNGECRAYFTETGPATICDINVVNGQLVILPTSVRPGEVCK